VNIWISRSVSHNSMRRSYSNRSVWRSTGSSNSISSACGSSN
jgi:hypothetical protein